MARQPRQERIGFYGKFQPTGADQSGARRMQALAGLAEQVGGMAEQFGIAKAEREAPEQALQAVEEARIVDEEGKVSYGEIEERRGYGADVYQNTVINAQLAQRKTDTTIRLGEIATEFADDPVGYENAAKAYSKATIDSAPIELRQALRSTIAPRIASNFATINSNFITRSEKESEIILNDSINITLVDLENLERSGEVDLVAAELPNLYSMIDAKGEADPLFNVEKAKNKVDNALYEQKTLRMLDDIADKDGVGAAMTALEEFQDKPLPKGYSQDDLRAFTVSAQQDINRKNSRLQASKTVASQEATTKVQDYITARTLGQPINEQERSTVYELAKGTKLEERLFLADEIGIFATASMQARNDMLNAAKGGGLDRADAYKAMLVANQDINNKAREDGISMYVSQGLGEPIQFDPLAEDFDSPENQQAFVQRQEQAKLASSHYGVSVSPLTDSEANALSNTVTQMTPQEKIELVNVFGSDSALWGQIAPKQQGVFAQAAASGDRVVQETVFKGQDLLANKLVTTLKASDGYMLDFNRMVENVYGPNDQRDTLDASLNYYYGSLEAGEDQYNPSKFKAAVQAVTGGVENIRGYATQLPRGIPDYDLDTYFDSIGFPNGQIKAIAGQGNYHVYGIDGIVVFNEDGAPKVFNVTQNEINVMKGAEQSGSFVEARQKKFMTPRLYRDR